MTTHKHYVGECPPPLPPPHVPEVLVMGHSTASS